MSVRCIGWTKCRQVWSQGSSMLLWRPVWVSLALHISLSRKSRAGCRISFLVMVSSCQVGEALPVQWLETGVAASIDTFWYPVLRRYGSQLLYRMGRWPYKASNNCVSMYHEIVSLPSDLRIQHSGPCRVCLRLMTWYYILYCTIYLGLSDQSSILVLWVGRSQITYRNCNSSTSGLTPLFSGKFATFKWPLFVGYVCHL